MESAAATTPRGEKRGFISRSGTNVPTTLRVETDRDWDVRPLCDRHNQVMSEGYRIQDGEIVYSWWCPHPDCVSEHMHRTRSQQQQSRGADVDDHPERVLRQYGVEPLFYGAAFASIKGQEKIVAAARKWAEAPEGNLFLHGPSGRGKTHLAIAIMRERIRCGHSNMQFRYIPELLMELRHTFDAGEETHVTEQDVIDRYSEYRLLVLDDLGAEKATDFAAQALDTIIDKRLRNMFPTIVTSNLTIAEVEEQISPRLASRLASGKVWEIQGRDWRKRR